MTYKFSKLFIVSLSVCFALYSTVIKYNINIELPPKNSNVIYLKSGLGFSGLYRDLLKLISETIKKNKFRIIVVCYISIIIILLFTLSIFCFKIGWSISSARLLEAIEKVDPSKMPNVVFTIDWYNLPKEYAYTFLSEQSVSRFFVSTFQALVTIGIALYSINYKMDYIKVVYISLSLVISWALFICVYMLMSPYFNWTFFSVISNIRNWFIRYNFVTLKNSLIYTNVYYYNGITIVDYIIIVVLVAIIKIVIYYCVKYISIHTPCIDSIKTYFILSLLILLYTIIPIYLGYHCSDLVVPPLEYIIYK